jgi:GNAT superfamily N-acetyltransferase
MDADGLVELWLQLSAAGHAADQRYAIRPDAATTARQFIPDVWLSAPDHRVVVAVDGSQLVGFMAVRLAPPHHVLEVPPTAVVTDAYVDVAYRRAGVGRRLFKDVHAWASAHGVRVLEVGTLAQDHRAVSFWRSLGFDDWRVALARSIQG